MAKALKTAAIIVGAVALVATGVGAAASIGAFGVVAAGSAASATLATVATIASVASVASGVLSLAAGLTAKKPSSEATGSQTSFSADPDAGIPAALGRTGTAGNIVARFGWDTADKGDNDRNAFVSVLSLGPVAEIEPTLSVDRVPVTFDGAGRAIGSYAGFMWRMTQRGLLTGAALTFGTGAGAAPGWTAQHKLSGKAATTWTLRFDTKAKLFQNGVPAPMNVVRGRLVYDPRKDSTYPGGSGSHRMADPANRAAYDAAVATWEYSENPYLHALGFVHGYWQRDMANPSSDWQRVMGMGAPDAGIDYAAYVEGANIADANGWKVGGIIYSGDDKWGSLKKILQAGMGEPLALGAKISCLVNAPKVSLATITADDVVGDCSVGATQPRRDRINTITPRYRLEANNWQLLPGAPLSVAEHVATDKGRRSRTQDYPLIQSTPQVGTAVRYDIENAREFGPIVLPCKLVWMGYKPGDCVTVTLPEVGLNGQTVLLLNRELEPSGGVVTLTARSETAGKHAFALGQTATPPPTPGVTGAPVVPVPGEAAWAISDNQLSANGAVSPALVVTGAIDIGTGEAVLFEYRRFVSGSSAGSGWIGATIMPPSTKRLEIVSVEPGTAYEVAVSYRIRGVVGERRILGPVTTAGAQIPWNGVSDPSGNRPEDNATNSADPNSAFGPGTVGEALATLDRIEPLSEAIELIDKAQIDYDALQRQAKRDGAQLHDAVLRGILESDRTRTVMRDAGITVDPASGRVFIAAVDQVSQRTSRVEIDLDATKTLIALSASRDYVNEQIAAAQLDPSGQAALEEVLLRLTKAEIRLDGDEAAISLKADATVVTLLSGRVSSVRQDLDALAGVVSTKAETTVVDKLGTKVSAVEERLGALGDTTGYSIDIRQARYQADTAAGNALEAILGSDDLNRRQLVAAAQVRQELYTRLVDGDAAEAAARTLLSVRLGTAEAAAAAETFARVEQGKALAQATSALEAKVGQDIAATVRTLNKAIADGDQASATSITQLDTRLDNFGGVTIEESFKTLVDRTGKIEGRYTVAVDANGNLAGFQLIGSDSGPASFNLINTDLRMGTGRVIFNNGTYMKVQGVAFGASGDFIEWYGPTMAITACTRANAISYLTTSGQAYFGGSLSAGVIKNAVQTTNTGPTASVATGTVRSNGRRRQIVVSYSWDRSVEMGGGNGAAANGSISAQVVLYRAGVEIGRLAASGEWRRKAYAGAANPATYVEQMGGSLTVNDDTGGTQVEYTASLVARTLGPSPTENIQSDYLGQIISIVETEE